MTVLLQSYGRVAATGCGSPHDTAADERAAGLGLGLMERPPHNPPLIPRPSSFRRIRPITASSAAGG